MEMTHSNFSKIPRMVPIPEIPVVEKSTSLTASTWMLSVFSNTTMAAADVPSHLTVLTKASDHLILWTREVVQAKLKWMTYLLS